MTDTPDSQFVPHSQFVPQSQFVYVTFIRTAPQTLWEALTWPEFTAQYWFGMRQESDWTVGAPWRMLFPDGRLADDGEILQIDPPHRLALTWRNLFHPELASEGYSRCSFELSPIGEAVKLTVTHEIDVADSKLIRVLSGGWPPILSNLKSLLETGTVALALDMPLPV